MSTTFENTLRSIIDNIVKENDAEKLGKLYAGILNAKNNNNGVYHKYPSHLTKHAMCNTSVEGLIQEWNHYVDACSFDTSTLPVMWYMWTDSLDNPKAPHTSSKETYTGDMEELHSSNHRMYMIARKYKKNIKLLKSKYADRKKQLRDLSSWYERFESNVKKLHVSLSAIMRYIQSTTVDTASCYSVCPTEEEMKNMTFEQLVQTVEDYVKEKNINEQTDMKTVTSYHIHQDDRLLERCNKHPNDTDDDDECDSVISSITDIIGEPAIASNFDDEDHVDTDNHNDASVQLGSLINYRIQNINQLLKKACVTEA